MGISSEYAEQILKNPITWTPRLSVEGDVCGSCHGRIPPGYHVTVRTGYKCDPTVFHLGCVSPKS